MGWMALINNKLEKIGIVGDTPWDIMGKAINDITAAYLKDWRRKPTLIELESIFEFVTGGCDGYEDQEGEPDINSAEEERNEGWEVSGIRSQERNECDQTEA